MLFYKANIHWKSEEEKTGTFCNAENNNYLAALQTLEQNQCQRLE